MVGSPVLARIAFMRQTRIAKMLLLSVLALTFMGLGSLASKATISTPTTWGAFFNDSTPDGSYLTYTNSNYFNIGANQNFTIAWWQYDTATPGSSYWPRIFLLGTSGNGNISVSEEGGTFYLWGTYGTSFSMTTIQNTWVHYAIVRSGSTITIYENGVSKATVTGSGAIGLGTDPLLIGTAHNYSTDQTKVAYGGYLTGFEWIVGTAKYTSAFTPAYSQNAYTTSVTTGTKLLLFPTSTATSTTDYSGNGITPNSNTGNVTYGYQLSQLATPTAPILSAVDGYSVVVSDTAVSNASSYVASAYTTTGLTFVESQTISSSAIANPTTISGLSPNTNYSIKITAIGDGVQYSNSSASSYTTITTGLGATSSSLSDALGGKATFRLIDTLTLTVTGVSTGKATFYQGTKAIPGCKGIAVASFTARCNWKPAQQSLQTISVAFLPSSTSYLSSTSQAIQVAIASRKSSR
jgi:Concanavalin A-like lectin/glucanases superfamily